MASEAQIQANRRNSQKSTGPRTEPGKAASSRNALKTGLYAQSLLIQGEDAEALDTLAREYAETCRPVGPREQVAVDSLVYADWLLRRMRLVETILWNGRIDRIREARGRDFDEDSAPGIAWSQLDANIDRIQRRLSALERSYHRALTDLQRLQANRPPDPEPAPTESLTSPIGFVSPSFVPPPIHDFPQPPSAPPAARISPMLGQITHFKPLQNPTGAEIRNINRAAGRI